MRPNKYRRSLFLISLTVCLGCGTIFFFITVVKSKKILYNVIWRALKSFSKLSEFKIAKNKKGNGILLCRISIS